ncbi:DUF6415 family natural product biosynthesis protein [Streptomyces sp. NPDC051320]|uniref:DUF6415 family natural product biosynthesis protein n=1 Tax=Streptomyces sp. NPDC051320 TaxID=3154644 RepID=UPI003430B43D
MTQITERSARAGRDPRPLDIVTMRESAYQLLAEDAELPLLDELQTLILLLRGHLMLLIPEVADVACRRPQDDPWRAAASVGIGEARRRLDLIQSHRLPVVVRHAQHLARSVNALCTHLENLAVNHA